MSIEFEVSLRTVCCTCLSTDRKLQKLCRISDGVNLLYLLLSCDPEAYTEIFNKNTTSLHVCWECAAIINKLRFFQTQASRVMRELNNICNTNEIHFKTFSNLTTYISTNYDTINQNTENFIDCGVQIKSEIDIDDIPLSELQGYENHEPGTTTKTITHKKNLPINLKNFQTDTRIKDTAIENDIEIRNNPRKDYIPTYKTITKLTNLKNSEKANENHTEFSDLENDTSDSLKGDFKETPNIIKKARKRKTTPINLKKDKQGNNIKKYKKNVYCSGNKKKEKKNGFNKTFDYTCPECNTSFENKNIRWKHIQKLHREGHKCTVCNKRFALKSNLHRHEKIHTCPPTREKCTTCNKFIRVDLMKTHILTHTDRQKYVCVSCDKIFVCRDTYHSHLKYSKAHGESDALARYKCSTCDKRYRSKAELRDHVNYQHKGQTEHKCPVCGKGLATKRCIRRHIKRAHEGIKENARDKICQRCGKAFRDKKSLREHEYIHTGERPLSCELCGQTFRQYASLYSHRKRVHKLIVPQKILTVVNKN